MQLAQRQSITHDRLTLWIAIRNDMRGIQEIRVLQPTYCALFSIRQQYPVSERPLVNSLSSHPRDVTTADVVISVVAWAA
jgi:hypothetical protein